MVESRAEPGGPRRLADWWRRPAGRRVFAVLALLLTAALAVLCPTAPARASTSDGVVEILAFTKSDCKDCEYFNKELLPRVKEKYGDRIKVRLLDVTQSDNIRKMVNIESAYGKTEMLLPQVYIDGAALIGPVEVKERLEELIDAFLAKGGTDMPVIPHENEAQSAPPPEAKPIYITYFYREGCRKCDPVTLQLDYLKKFDSQVVMRQYDLMTTRGIEMNEAMCSYAGVPDKERAVAPSVFVGYDYLSGKNLTGKGIKEAVEKVRNTGTPDPWHSIEEAAKRAKDTISARFKGYTVFAVMGAGLLDGVNPCAFTVLIFLVSYLAFIDRRGREVLMVGGAFSAAVFVTYLLIGLGFLSFVRVLGGAGKWFTLAVAIITVLFGLVSLRDYIVGRRKGKATSTLGLSDNITRRIHKIVREKTKARYFVVAAAGLGFLIAVLELGCTGQVYLPTIAFIARTGGEKLKAILYLIAYNVMFILPLLIIFGLVYFGTGSEKLVEFGRRHTQTMKLLAALLFFGLAALLFATL